MRACVLLMFAACGSQPLEFAPIDMSVADLQTACRPACGAGEICNHPCNDLVYCWPLQDGGCPPRDRVGVCALDGAVGCSFDFTPRCVPLDQAPSWPRCRHEGPDLICPCP
jgi:hypothetical protein